ALPGQPDDARDHVLHAEAGRVELDRVRRGAQRAVVALAVAGVATRLGLQDRAQRLAGLRRPATRTLLGVRGQEDLERGVRAHHRADVPSLGDVAAGADQLALARDHRRPDLGVD